MFIKKNKHSIIIFHGNNLLQNCLSSELHNRPATTTRPEPFRRRGDLSCDNGSCGWINAMQSPDFKHSLLIMISNLVFRLVLLNFEPQEWLHPWWSDAGDLKVLSAEVDGEILEEGEEESAGIWRFELPSTRYCFCKLLWGGAESRRCACGLNA